MTAAHILLAISCIALIGVIAAQDYLYAPLRQETISQGLSGPFHWWLDASYLLLAVALVWASIGHPVTLFLATISAVSLVLTAATNTFATQVDALTGGKHSLWHSRFTSSVFLSALALQISADRGVSLWSLTAASIAAPAIMYLLSKRSDYAEKVGVLLLCVWLIAWTLT